MEAAAVFFPAATEEICEQRARLATFLKEMYERECPSRVARACEEVFINGILDFFRERYVEWERHVGYEVDDRYFFEERAERERELQDLAAQIITHAGDFNSRMLRSAGNWAVTYMHPRDPRVREREVSHDFPFFPDCMHLRVLEDEYVPREDPTGYLGDMQPDKAGKSVLLQITPGLWDYVDWAHVQNDADLVPHVRLEVSTAAHLHAMRKKENRKSSGGRGQR